MLLTRADPKLGYGGMAYDPDFDSPCQLSTFDQDRRFPFSDTAKFVRYLDDWGKIKDCLALHAGYGAATVNSHARVVFLVKRNQGVWRLPSDRLLEPQQILELDTEGAQGRCFKPEAARVSDNFLIFDAGSNQAATHAIVIGVGDYPHLIGGSGDRTESHDGMKQLTSPPVSARAFANWLLKNFRNPDAPLGSVQLLLSEKNACPFQMPDTTEVDVGQANLENIKTAIAEWRKRADLHLDNMTIFYFCGHGISEGNSMVLLPSDFGSEDNAFAHSIDFLNIYNAMDQYKAQKQVFFVDACRASSDSLHGNRGVNLLQDRPREADGTRIGPVYYATLKDELAFGQQNEASYFTTALLDCLSHFGADYQEGDWRTSNFGLAEALDHIMDQFVQAGSEEAQTPDSTEVRKKFAINHLSEEPHALLYVRGEPEQRFTVSSFRCTDSTQNSQVQGPMDQDTDIQEWMFRVTSGATKVEAFEPVNGQESGLVSGEVTVNPPYQRFSLDLQ